MDKNKKNKQPTPQPKDDGKQTLPAKCQACSSKSVCPLAFLVEEGILPAEALAEE